MKSNKNTIETFISEFDHKDIRCGNLSLVAKRMDYDLSLCCLFNFCEAQYSEWNDNLKEKFKSLKSFYLIEENSTIFELENAIKIMLKNYKLSNVNWYIQTEYSKSLSNTFKNI